MIASLKALLELLPNASTASALHTSKREREDDLSPQTADSSRASSPARTTQSPPTFINPGAPEATDMPAAGPSERPAKKRSRESGRKTREGRSRRGVPSNLPMRTSELGAPDWAGDPTFRGGDPSIAASEDAFAQLTGMSLEQAGADQQWQGTMPPHMYAPTVRAPPPPMLPPPNGHWQQAPQLPMYPQSAARSTGPFSFGDFDVNAAVLPPPRPFNLQQPPAPYVRQMHPGNIAMPDQRSSMPMMPTASSGQITSPPLDPSMFGAAAIDWTVQDPFASWDWRS